MIETEAIASPRPDWGHPLITPEGAEIRVPANAFPRLRRLGLLQRGRAILVPQVYEWLDPQYDTLTDGLRHLLGSDLSGPAWLVCNCRECQRRESEFDQTLDPTTARVRTAMMAEAAVAEMRKQKHRKR